MVVEVRGINEQKSIKIDKLNLKVKAKLMVQKICYCSIKLASYESYHVFKVWDNGQGKSQGQTRLDQAKQEPRQKNVSLP